MRSALEDRSLDELSDLEKEGVILRFEYTYELAWKTMKDYLEHNGTIFVEGTARNVFKEAYAADMIDNREMFVEMMLSRNLLSHVYDFATFEKLTVRIKHEFLPLLGRLYDYFVERSVE